MMTHKIRKGTGLEIVIRDKTLNGFDWLIDWNILGWVCWGTVVFAVLFFAGVFLSRA